MPDSSPTPHRAPEAEPHSTRGAFISLEGIDGAGKSSHIDALARWFQDGGREVVVTREPGGTPLAEKLRGLLLNHPMDPLTEALLMFAARREHLVNVIEPALVAGRVVISDRFTDATFAYQGGGRGFDWHTLSTLERMVQQLGPESPSLRQPDLTLWFDLPPEVAAQRLAGARQPDRFEVESADFFRRVREGYARRVQEQPHRFAVIPAEHPRDDVARSVMQAVSAWWQADALKREWRSA